MHLKKTQVSEAAAPCAGHVFPPDTGPQPWLPRVTELLQRQRTRIQQDQITWETCGSRDSPSSRDEKGHVMTN